VLNLKIRSCWDQLDRCQYREICWTGHNPAYETKELTEMWHRREDGFESVIVIAKVWDYVVDSRKHC
jgi:hypothetical protein